MLELFISFSVLSFLGLVYYIYNKNDKTIGIHGLIASGKSTVSQRLIASGMNVPEEPVNKWRNMGILAEFYKNQDRWFYTFQVNALLTRVNQEPELIMESSALQDVVFGASHFGMPDEERSIEAKAYWEFVNYAIKTHPNIFPKTVIFLKVSPETAYERIVKRNRIEEIKDKEWWINYLTKLNAYHNKVYRYFNIKVVEIDAENYPEDIYRTVRFAIAQNI